MRKSYASNFGNLQFVDYDLETYYMPENRRNEVSNTLHDRKAVAKIRVDAQGHAVRLRVGDKDVAF